MGLHTERGLRPDSAITKLAGIELLLWTPTPPKGTAAQGGKAAASLAASQYAEKAVQILRAEGGSFGTNHLGHHGLVVHSWRSFLRRWLSAASAGNQVSYFCCGLVTVASAPPPFFNHFFALLLTASVCESLVGFWVQLGFQGLALNP